MYCMVTLLGLVIGARMVLGGGFRWSNPEYWCGAPISYRVLRAAIDRVSMARNYLV